MVLKDLGQLDGCQTSSVKSHIGPAEALCEAYNQLLMEYNCDLSLAKSTHLNNSNIRQLHQLLAELQANRLACDLRWTLFAAAAGSFRYLKLLTPFPHAFLNENSENEPDINRISSIITNTPRLELIQRQLMEGQYEAIATDLADLLHFVLLEHSKYVTLNSLRLCEFEPLYKRLRTRPPHLQPTHIFEVQPGEAQAKRSHFFNSLRRKYSMRVAYYSGPLELYYAWLSSGHLPEGKPLVLHSDLNVAFKQATADAGWGASRCGAFLRCVAAVEFALMPEHVFVESDALNYHNQRVLIADASCTQLAYLLLHGQSSEQLEASLPSNQLVSWAQANRPNISLGVYIMIMSLSMRTKLSYVGSWLFQGWLRLSSCFF